MQLTSYFQLRTFVKTGESQQLVVQIASLERTKSSKSWLPWHTPRLLAQGLESYSSSIPLSDKAFSGPLSKAFGYCGTPAHRPPFLEHKLSLIRAQRASHAGISSPEASSSSMYQFHSLPFGTPLG